VAGSGVPWRIKGLRIWHLACVGGCWRHICYRFATRNRLKRTYLKAAELFKRKRADERRTWNHQQDDNGPHDGNHESPSITSSPFTLVAVPVGSPKLHHRSSCRPIPQSPTVMVTVARSETLSLAFTESRIFPMLAAQYHDGTTERSLIQDGVNNPESIRSWKLSKRLSAVVRPGETVSDYEALKDFFDAHQGGIAFYFYVPWEQSPGQPVGSNYDASGTSTQGRHVCRFTTQVWTESTGIAFTDVALEMIEVA
jgi:hypothetical protein